MRRTTDDRIVIVSNYTETLDLLQRMCVERSIGYFRLDGDTQVSKRQNLVDQFNSEKDKSKQHVFVCDACAKCACAVEACYRDCVYMRECGLCLLVLACVVISSVNFAHARAFYSRKAPHKKG